jgi:curved DNA-binding protein CbpA
MSDYYQMLGVTPSASTAEIRQAYARIARERHPDRFTDPALKREAESAFQDVTAAFNTLMRPDLRAQYDQERHRPTPRGPADVASDAFERARAALESGELEEAVTLLRTAVHHAPEQAAYHAALGRALGRLPAFAREAVQALEKATRLEPGNAGAFAELAVVLARQGLKLRAQKAAETAARLAPRDLRIARLAAELGIGRADRP